MVHSAANNETSPGAPLAGGCSEPNSAERIDRGQMGYAPRWLRGSRSADRCALAVIGLRAAPDLEDRANLIDAHAIVVARPRNAQRLVVLA